MSPIALWMALALGVDAGYEPVADGHLEYIVQIEPQLLEALASGSDITSEVPRGLDIRHFRLTVGNAVLPHLLPTGEQGPTTGREADAFEAPGRGDEPIGVTTPQVKAKYELVSDTVGQYVIEINPQSVGDLNRWDLTDDIPSEMRVTRFVVSTRPGSADSDAPNELAAASIPTTAPAALAAAAAGTAAATVDDDPSSWKDEPPPTTTPFAPAPLMKVEPQQGPGVAPAIPDDPVNGSFAPPPADEPTALQPRGAPGTIQQPQAGSQDGVFHGRFPVPEAGSVPATGQPSRIQSDPSSEPLDRSATQGRMENGMSERKLERSNRSSKNDEREESKDAEAPKPWLPLTVALLTLFASLGGNVFLGWVAWDSYTRRSPGSGKFVGGKASMSS
ncbi:MAG TPA: hypothetical protein VMF30_03450 [Pirellulales bacterium]|nr:hypothetical protein [Pirellulales bacterium]